MIDLSKLKEYLNIYVKYLDNINNTRNYISTNEEKEAFSIISSKLTEGNEEFNSLINLMQAAPNLSTKQKMIDQYIKDEELKQINDEKKLISKIYGINIANVEHKYLQNGKEIFAFYDKKLNRKRVLENVSKESLTEQLKKIQNEKEIYQTTNYSENSEEILKDDAYENKSELQMIYAGDIEEYKMLINNLDSENLRNFKELIGKQESLNLMYFNIENQIALDKDGRIYESIYVKKEGKSKIETPQSYKYNDEEMSTEDKTIEKTDDLNEEKGIVMEDENIDIEEEIKDEYLNEYEDLAELITSEYKTYYVDTKVDVNGIFQKIQKYYETPELMDDLVGNEKEFYEKMVNIYAEKKEQKQKQVSKNSRSLKLTNPDNNYGFSYALLLTIIVVVAFIIILFFIKG